MGTNIAINITKNFSGKYNQNLFDHAKQYSTDALKTSSKRVVQKEEATCDLIGNWLIEFWKSKKIRHKIIQKQLQMKEKEIPKDKEKDKEIPNESIYIFRGKTGNYWWSEINIKK